MKTARQQLKEALLDLEKPRYETVRENIIAEIGYDAFRDMQNSIFGEIGTIRSLKGNNQK